MFGMVRWVRYGWDVVRSECALYMRGTACERHGVPTGRRDEGGREAEEAGKQMSDRHVANEALNHLV